MDNNLISLKKEIQKLADPQKAKILQRFFKTQKGEYGEGDIFLGVNVPLLRKIAKKHKDLSLTDLRKLIQSKFHEYRQLALFVLVSQYQSSDNRRKKELFDFYLSQIKYINNWDLVDLSASQIVGNFLLERGKKILYKLARSNHLWSRRIAIVATYAFIKNNQFNDTLKIATILLDDRHDLIHKATGWMLREVGKRNQALEEEFLQQYYQQMPRIMLRYAIEKFNPTKRKFYLRRTNN
jgi:3-methyladenine DNA glycosylase AlkD